jgi:hypothetical protein
MGKRIFWIFILLVALSTAAVIVYIQSEAFANIVKREIQKTVSRDLGIELNFDRVRIGILPPSISLQKVDLQVKSKANGLGLSTDTIFRAERLGFSFRMIQAFSRGISVNKVFLSDGEIDLFIPKSQSNQNDEKLSDLVHRPIVIRVDDKFLISIRQIEIRNTKAKVSWRGTDGIDSVAVEKISYLAVTPSSDVTNLVTNLENIELKMGSTNEGLAAFKLNLDIRKNRVEISTIDIQRRLAVLHGVGALKGTIDSPEEMIAELNFILRSPLKELADYEKSLQKIEGDLKGDVQLLGRLASPEVAGRLTVDGLSFEDWKLDTISLDGRYRSSGELELKRLDAVVDRGKISMTNPFSVKFPLSSQTLDLSLNFSDVDFHKFAGGLKKSVNNLLMKINGQAQVALELRALGKKVEVGDITIRPNLQVTDLELNNQVFGKSREYKTIFKVRPIQVNGNLLLSDGNLKVNSAELKLASGTVLVEGGVTEQRGFELKGKSEFIDLGQEVGAISGIPIQGAGSAGIFVYGKGDAVKIDFDVKQKNAKFINFDFGELEGKVTYDDGRSYIYLEGIRGTKGTSAYAANGKVNIGDGDDIDLDVTFEKSDPNDLFAIFAHQLKDISWIPHGMGGTIKGNAKVGGGYARDLYTLEISGKATGENLSYLGEMVQTATFDYQLKDAALTARILDARKYESSIFGFINYKLSGEMDYSIELAKGKLRSIDWFSNSGLPIDGLFQLKSKGRGKWETLESKSTFEISNAYVRTKSIPDMKVELETGQERSKFSLNLGQGATVLANWGYSEKSDSSAQANFNRADFNYLLCAISKKNCNDANLGLLISGDMKLNWKGKDWKKMFGRGEISDLIINRTGFQLRSPDPIEILAANGVFSVGKMKMVGEGSRLNLKLRGSVDGSSLENSIVGEVSLKILELITPVIEEARGNLGVNLTILGDVVNSKFRGSLQIQDGFLRLSGVDAPVDGVTGFIRFADNRVNLEGFNGQIGGGSVQAKGNIDLYLNRAPKFDLEINLANNRLKFYPVNFAEISDAKIGFTGDKPPYLLSGTARVKRVMMRNNFDLSGGGGGAKNARYLPEKIGGAKSFYEIRIKAIAENGVFVQNNLLDAEFKGEVTLLNTFEFPQIVARAELVRGKLLFRNTAFTLDHAYIRAPNPEVFNPQFSIGGVANVDSYRISIFASGTIEKPKISLSSSPSIPQEDIVSLLAFGYRGEDARKVNPSDTSAITYSEVGSILLEQLQINQNLSSKGLKVSVSPSLNESEASIIRPNSTQTASPKVNVKTQIMKNLDASFGGTVGSAQGQSLDARLEYRLSRKASVSAVYEQTPGLDINDVKSSYGADLKFRWGFK